MSCTLSTKLKPDSSGVQGSLHPNVLAAKAVCLGEALRPEFRDYGRRVVENARTLAATLAERGIGIVGGGTDTHMVLLDLGTLGLLGSQAESVLARAGITSNKNPVPFDARSPSKWTGLRLGVSAVTTRGFGASRMRVLGECIADLILAEARSDPAPALRRAGRRIARLGEDGAGLGRAGPREAAAGPEHDTAALCALSAQTRSVQPASTTGAEQAVRRTGRAAEPGRDTA